VIAHHFLLTLLLLLISAAALPIAGTFAQSEEEPPALINVAVVPLHATVQSDRWTACSIRAENSSGAWSGTISPGRAVTRYRGLNDSHLRFDPLLDWPLELTAPAQQARVFYFPGAAVQNHQRGLTTFGARVDGREGSQRENRVVRLDPPSGSQTVINILALDERKGVLDFITRLEPINKRYGEVVVDYAVPALLPGREIGYDQTALIIFGRYNYAAIQPLQWQALDKWLRHGGHVLILPEADAAQMRGLPPARWLAVTADPARPISPTPLDAWQIDLNAIHQWGPQLTDQHLVWGLVPGTEAQLISPTPVPPTPYEDSESQVDPAQFPVYRRVVAAGIADQCLLTTDQISAGLPDDQPLWERYIYAHLWDGHIGHVSNQLTGGLTRRHFRFAAPPLWVSAGFAALYFLFVTFGIVAHRRRPAKMTIVRFSRWIAIVIGGFSLLAVAAAWNHWGGRGQAIEAGLILAREGDDDGQICAQGMVLSPTRRQLRLVSRHPNLWTSLPDDDHSLRELVLQLRFEAADPELSYDALLPSSVWRPIPLSFAGAINLGGAITSNLRGGTPLIAGEVRNSTRVDLTQCAVLYRNSVYPLQDLKANDAVSLGPPADRMSVKDAAINVELGEQPQSTDAMEKVRYLQKQLGLLAHELPVLTARADHAGPLVGYPPTLPHTARFWLICPLDLEED